MARPGSGLCPQCERNSVWAADGSAFGFGRCRSCAVVLKYAARKWRLLTEAEWAARPDLMDLRPWADWALSATPPEFH